MSSKEHGASRRDWLEISSDPDPVTDLGYEGLDLEVQDPEMWTDDFFAEYLFYPPEPDMGSILTYITAEADSVVDLEDWR